MVKLTIDGKPVEVPEGTTILEAARKAGIYIPTLCYLEKIEPIGSCRICVVEVEGLRNPVTSCNTPVRDGIVVTTQSERLTALRKEALQFLLIDHPLDCPVCDKAGECRLQDLVFELDVVNQPFSVEPVEQKIDYSSPLIERYSSRCIRCMRCVNVCWEVQGFGAYRLSGSGYETLIDTLNGEPLNCDFCGQCIQACPVGALINKLFKYRARAWELTKIPSVCPYCGRGCQLELHVKEGRLYRVLSSDEDTINNGNLCSRGFFGYGFVHSEARLKGPKIRANGELKDASWKEALDFAANKLKEVIQAKGPGAVAGIGSARATNEDNYVFQKFMRLAVGTNNIFCASIEGHDLVMGLMEKALGRCGSTAEISELKDKNVILVVGSDLAVEMPTASLPVIHAARDHGARLVVINPVRTKLDDFSTRSLRCAPGTEAAVLLAMMKIMAERKLHDEKAMKRIEGYGDLAKRLSELPLAELLDRAGVVKEDIESAVAELVSDGEKAVVLGKFAIQGPEAEKAIAAAIDMALLLGAEQDLLATVTRCNAQGALEMGVAPAKLPGFVDIGTAAAGFGKKWGKEIPDHGGLEPDAILEGIEAGRISALYVMGADPASAFARSSAWREALSKLDLLIVQDPFLTATAERAHVVFPACTFAEKEGTFINAEHRLQKLSKALPKYGMSRPDWAIVAQMSGRLGHEMAYAKAEEIFRELAELVPWCSGLDYNAIGTRGIKVGFGDEKKRAFLPVEEAVGMGEAPEGRPFVLIAGSALHHNGTLSTRAEGPLTIIPEGYAEINPDDASERSINNGDAVVLRNDLGEAVVKAKLTSRVPRGVLFAPPHFAESGVAGLLDRGIMTFADIEKK